MSVFNIIFFAIAFRLLGNGSYPRWFLVTMVSLILFCNEVYHGWAGYNLFIHFALSCCAFVNIRLLATKPLLDCTHYGTEKAKRGLVNSVIRNSPLLPITYLSGNYLLALFVWQGVIYWLAGRFERTERSVSYAEIASGALFGGVI